MGCVVRENPEAVIFAATRTKYYDKAISTLTKDHFGPTYLCAVVSDGQSMRIVARKGGTFTIPWTRILSIEASTTRDYHFESPCVMVHVSADSDPVDLPLIAHKNPWNSLFMTRPSTIRELVAELTPPSNSE